jgi:hypothetical protein
MDKILDLKVGHSTDWKFGLITRDVYRISDKYFELTEISGGSWLNAKVSKETMTQILEGKKSLLTLNWR